MKYLKSLAVLLVLLLFVSCGKEIEFQGTESYSYNVSEKEMPLFPSRPVVGDGMIPVIKEEDSDKVESEWHIDIMREDGTLLNGDFPYGYVSGFSEGVCFVKEYGKETGYVIDKIGEKIFDKVEGRAIRNLYPYTMGFSVANLEDKSLVLIDKNGENLNLPVSGLKPDEPIGPGLPMDKDLRITVYGEDGLYGLYDLKSDKKVTDLEYSYVSPVFFNHLTVVLDKKQNINIIDDSGNIKCDLSKEYDDLDYNSPILFPNTILLARKNKSHILVDYEGKALKDLSDLNIEKIGVSGKGKGAENFLSFITKDGKYGIMDSFGNIALESEYDEIISIGDFDDENSCFFYGIKNGNRTLGKITRNP